MTWILGLMIAVIAASSTVQQPELVRFKDSFWVNLHHFLYVLGRAKANVPDAQRRAVADAPKDAADGLASLSEEDSRRWNRAVEFYQNGLSKKDAVFDDEMIGVSNALARDEATTSLRPELRAILDEAAPIYRKTWYPKHAASNARTIESLNGLIARYGAGVVKRVTRIYGESWPSSGAVVYISGYTNWAGAYSTQGPFIAFSSMDPGIQGLLGFEIIVHEAMHQWDDSVESRLNRVASRVGISLPPQLSHAMIFYTAGYVVQQEVGPSYVPYAEANGMWRQRGMGMFKKTLDDHWRPYLSGTGNLDQAIEAVLRGL